MHSRFAELIIALGDKAPELRDLFDAATDVPAAARDAWIEQNVADVHLHSALRELLAADVEKGVLDTSAEQLHERIVPRDLTPEGLLGQQIGGFRLVRTLGQGGMAVVFLGERVGRDFAQRAAIKLLRRGLYSELEQRLFLRERRVLASLEHPNIARLIDGGVTDAGIPYLVLEYVDGQSITHYADAHRLDVAQRLTLFLAVCSAVEAAHRALIVHRDIKPSNILVAANGEVKLLDFGIAKLIEDESDVTGTVGVFTRDYAAPEQVRGGAITTATDVYGLGVLLHELLVGKKPGIGEDDAGLRRPSSLARSSAEENGTVPTHSAEQLRRQLRGDLDNIVLKALESDPARRYPSAGAFGDDITRHLSGRPVLAHPPTHWYRTRKFIQRHRGGVTITAALVVAVFAALGLALWQADVARREALSARTEAAKATQVADFASQMLSSVDPNRAKAMDRSLMLLVLDAGARKAQLSLAAQPAVRSAIEEIIGDSYYSISEFALADAHLQAAQEAAHLAALDNATQTRLATQRAIANFSLGNRRDDARALDAQAVALATALPENDHDRLHAEGTALAHECFWRPNASCSERFARITAHARAALAENDPYLLAILRGQSVAEGASGHFAQVGTLNRELVDRNKAIYGDEDSRTLQAIRNLANYEATHGKDLADGERLLRANLPVAERVLGAEQLITIEMIYDLGRNLAEQKRYVEAKPLLQHALSSLSRLNGADAFNTVLADHTLTRTLLALNELDAAEQHARARIASATASGHGDHGIFRTLLADVLIAERRYPEAEHELNEVHAAAAHDATHAGDAMANLAESYVSLYTAWNKPEQAQAWRKQIPPSAAEK